MIASNLAFAALFPSGEPPVNLWCWSLFAPAAPEVLIGWESRWAPRLLANLKLAYFRAPQDTAMRHLHARSTHDPRLEQIERSGAGIGGAPLPLRHPVRGEGEAHVLASRGAGASFLTVVFEPHN
ncbi:hypothetical protein OG786_01475 [Streptomyces sp. NBC_00101]|uniref:MmyB family transcriptional regulator n=1 Tax=Streptomyces sp. NBC_00101 TaxID=2975651 RepID=UPI003252DFC8